MPTPEEIRTVKLRQWGRTETNLTMYMKDNIKPKEQIKLLQEEIRTLEEENTRLKYENFILKTEYSKQKKGEDNVFLNGGVEF